MSALRVEGLTTVFPSYQGPVPAVSDVSFSVDGGRCLALVGESGCGKSVTALSILRLVPRPGRIESGKIVLDGTDLLGLSVPEMRQVRGKRLSIIFQEPMTSLNPVMRIGDQLTEGLCLHQRVSATAAKARALEFLGKVGIPDPALRFAAYPHQLSGGLKQRVAIAMALINEPDVLLADEPTTALDVSIQAQIIVLLRHLMRDLGTAIVLITHDLGVVNQIADDVAVMYAGRIVEQAPRGAFLERPLHPYSVGLLGALPGRARAGERLAEIPGHVPRFSEIGAGCAFRSRCSRADAACEVRPLLLAGGGGRLVACHYSEQVGS